MIYVLSGSGTDLNLKVAGGTSAPASPKENTLWVNTSTAISSWDFSSEQPDSPAAGQVWIKTKDSADVTANVLRKNGIWLGIGGAKQYIGGAWENRDAKIYRSGAWVDLLNELWLFDGGDNESVSGGWAENGSGTLTVGSTLKMELSNSDKTFPKASNVYALNKVDLSAYDKLEVSVSACSGSNWTVGVSETIPTIGTYPPAVSAVGFIASVSLNSTGTFEIDISAVDTECYVMAYVYLSSVVSGTNTASAAITGIALS